MPAKTTECRHYSGTDFRRVHDRLYWTCIDCGEVASKIMPPNWDGGISIQSNGQPITIYV